MKYFELKNIFSNFQPMSKHFSMLMGGYWPLNKPSCCRGPTKPELDFPISHDLQNAEPADGPNLVLVSRGPGSLVPINQQSEGYIEAMSVANSVTCLLVVGYFCWLVANSIGIVASNTKG